LVRDPLVSVMMITFNHEAYIRKAIDCVLAQETDFPFELVIGEDHSTDATREIVLEYAQRHPSLIRVLTSDSNVGVRRNGWRTHWSCRGTFIAWCEGDDYWQDPRKLQKQIDMLEADDQMVLVHTELDCWFEAKQVRVTQYQRRRGFKFDSSLTPQQRFNAILLGEEKLYTATVCYRRTVMEEIMREDPFVFQETYFPMGDTSRFLELALRGRFGYIDESTTTFRRIAESATRGKDYQRLSDFATKAVELRLYYKQKYGGVNEQSFNRWLNELSMRALYLGCLAGDAATARRIHELFPQLNWSNRLLYLIAVIKPLSAVFRGLVGLPLMVRRRYRKLRYGIESSI
jgi:glycosyltransferase involved in cell wall biosynthesis